ncbi:hypothetical protein FXO38_19401 [Capsicum annuum]|nr:hypothetical protein FXO37_29365 [Capsicum annuum]KAF3645939.1 hypothetical protein FXO38_19401 [Capsicum annuum]
MSLPVMGRLVASIGLACSAIFQWVFDGGRVYPANFAVMVTGSDSNDVLPTSLNRNQSQGSDFSLWFIGFVDSVKDGLDHQFLWVFRRCGSGGLVYSSEISPKKTVLPPVCYSEMENIEKTFISKTTKILGALQELFASELVARVDAMISATDNAVELKRNLSVAYRQAKITVEVLVIVAGGAVLT